MSKIRVLVVDDAVVVRRMVSDLLDSDPDIEVVGVAANGAIALASIPRTNPDVVVLDIEMPEMDGLTALPHIRRQWPRLPVIMFSTLTERGARASLDALALGASDYVTKPSGAGTSSEAMRRVHDELVPKIKGLCTRRATIATHPPATPRPRAIPFVAPRPPSSVKVVVIGVSTGGPNALADLLPALPGDLGVPILIVQHMPPTFTRMLAERLDAKSGLSVHEARGGEIPAPGNAYLAQGGFHLLVSRQDGAPVLSLSEDPPESSCRPAVDVLFRTAAATYGSGTLAVVLTGMGQDGLRGCEVIRTTGGQVIAQDEASSVVWGMPGAVAAAGLADRILPLQAIALEIATRVAHRRVSSGALR